MLTAMQWLRRSQAKLNGYRVASQSMYVSPAVTLYIINPATWRPASGPELKKVLVGFVDVPNQRFTPVEP